MWNTYCVLMVKQLPNFLNFLFQNLIEKIGVNGCQKVNLSKIENQLIQSTKKMGKSILFCNKGLPFQLKI